MKLSIGWSTPHLDGEVSMGWSTPHLDGEVEHEAVGVLLGKLVEELSPCWEFYHLIQPSRGLQTASYDTVLRQSYKDMSTEKV